MCVICYIPKKSKGLNFYDIKKMWDANPNGAGIMFVDENKDLYFKKGYFNLEDLYRDYLIIKEDYNYECAIHFRIATSGGINEGMCHPFVVTNNEDIIVKTQGRADVLMMHNGIINIPHRNNFSDTAEYVMKNVWKYYKNDPRFFLHLNRRNKALIENEIGFGSKLLFFSGDGVEMVGNWFEYKDTFCSNLYFDYSSLYKWK